MSPMSPRGRSPAAGPRPSGCSRRRSTTRSSRPSSRASTRQVSAADYDLLLCTTHSRREKEAAYVARLSHGMVDGLLIVLPHGPAGLRRDPARRALPVRAHRPRQRRARLHRRQRRQPGRDEGGHRLPHRSWASTHRVHHRTPGRRGCPRAARGLSRRARGRRAGARRRPSWWAVTSWRRAVMRRPTSCWPAAPPDRHLRVERRGRVRRPGRGPGARRSTSRATCRVLGFDDIAEAAYVDAALSTVRQPLREMGRIAVRRW